MIWEDADLDLALDSVIWSAFGTSGQRCTAASRIVVHRSIHDQFVQALRARVATLVLGDGLEDATDVGPVINDRRAGAHRGLRGDRPRERPSW